jgi:cell wall-associated NlpC family hydrolase
MRVRAPGRALEFVTSAFSFVRPARAALAAVLVPIALLAATAAGPRPVPAAAPASPPHKVLVTASVDDMAELIRLQHDLRADRSRRQPDQAAATATRAAVAVARPTRVVVVRHAAVRAAAPRPRRAQPATQPIRAAGAGVGAVVGFALGQVGLPYVFGADGPRAYDCSGLVLAAYARVGVRLPHDADAIGGMGRPVPRSQWQAGDVLHWPGHVAIYLGGGQMVAASRPGRPISVSAVYGSPQARRLL